MKNQQDTTIGNRIFTIRDSHHLTQEEFAGKLFVTPATISRYETDNRSPSIDFLVRLHKKFDADLYWVLFGKESELNLGLNNHEKEILTAACNILQKLTS